MKNIAPEQRALPVLPRRIGVVSSGLQEGRF